VTGCPGLVWVRVLKICCIKLIDPCPERLIERSNEAQHALQKKDVDDVPAGNIFKSGFLCSCPGRVHHDSALMACVYDHPDNPPCVAKAGPPKQEIAIS
jgi:hypothetical protein